VLSRCSWEKSAAGSEPDSRLFSSSSLVRVRVRVRVRMRVRVRVRVRVN